MKEQKLIEMMNKLDKLDNIMKEVINEMMKIRSLSVGTLEALKRMKGYDKAIEQLKADAEKEKQPQSNSSLFNWTETTSDIDLENIFHIRITGQKGEKYMCMKCKATSNYYRLAEKHFKKVNRLMLGGS